MDQEYSKNKLKGRSNVIYEVENSPYLLNWSMWKTQQNDVEKKAKEKP